LEESEIVIDRPKGTAHPRYPDFGCEIQPKQLDEIYSTALIDSPSDEAYDLRKLAFELIRKH
jgi:hypothetical protein